MKEFTRHEILARMCTVLNVSVEEIRGKGKTRDIVKQRRMISWFLHTELKMGCSEQGRLLKRNHATILHSLKRMEDELFLYKDTQEEYAKFEREAKINLLTDDAIEALTLL